MQFIVSGDGVRVLSAAVHYLSQLGREVLLEATGEGVTLRALNDGRSSFAAVTLRRPFFESFAEPPAGSLKCRVSGKPLRSVFKALRGVERVRLYFAADGAAHYMVFQLHCSFGARAAQRSTVCARRAPRARAARRPPPSLFFAPPPPDVTRTHSLYYEDCEVLEAVFDRAAALHLLVARPGLISNVLQSMKGTDEVTLISSPSSAVFKSFHRADESAASVASATMHSALAIPAAELLRYELTMQQRTVVDGEGAQHVERYGCFDATFSTRDLQLLLEFAGDAAVKADELAILYSGPGMPILFSTEGASSRARARAAARAHCPRAPGRNAPLLTPSRARAPQVSSRAAATRRTSSWRRPTARR